MPAATAARISADCGPAQVSGRRRPAHLAQLRRAMVGCRWAMPTMARSSSTWRTGWSVSAARRSRQAATDCATRRGVPCSWRISLTRRQACSGSRPPRSRRRTASHSSSTHCRRPRASRSASQLLVDLEQVLDVAGGVGELVVVERSGQPVGQAVALGHADAQDALVERGQRRRGHADEPGRDLGVEQVGRDRCRRPGRAPRGPGRRRAARPRRPRRGSRPAGRCRPPADRSGPARRSRPPGPGPASGSRCARGGTRCRPRRPGVAQGVEHGRRRPASVSTSRWPLTERSCTRSTAPPVSTGKPASIQARVPPATLTTS